MPAKPTMKYYPYIVAARDMTATCAFFFFDSPLLLSLLNHTFSLIPTAGTFASLSAVLQATTFFYSLLQDSNVPTWQGEAS